jgi:hypothetical protein
MNIPDTTNPAIVAPYPKSTRELRSLRYGTIGPAPEKIAWALRGLQSNHVVYINKQVLPESKDNTYQREFSMIQAAFNSVAGFDDGSDTPKNYKDVLKHKSQAWWWASIEQEFNAMEANGVWEFVLMSSMPPGRKVVGNIRVPTENELWFTISVKVPGKISMKAMHQSWLT